MSKKQKKDTKKKKKGAVKDKSKAEEPNTAENDEWVESLKVTLEQMEVLGGQISNANVVKIADEFAFLVRFGPQY